MHLKPWTNEASLHKYNVQDVYRNCEKYLIATLNVNNVLERLAIGYLVNSLDLVKSSTEFVLNKIGKLTKTEKWILIQKEHPDIANKIVDTVMFSQSTNTTTEIVSSTQLRNAVMNSYLIKQKSVKYE
jgi:hydroxymethylpyrimidine/phosphomethylpyrimidine kinase